MNKIDDWPLDRLQLLNGIQQRSKDKDLFNTITYNSIETQN